MGEGMNTNTIRAFIAIELDQRIEETISKLSHELSIKLPHRLRWVKADLIHLTLNFLGNIPAAKTGILTDLMNATVNNIQPFEVAFRGLGCFPNLNRPRVIWIGMEQSSDLNELQKSLTDALKENGFEIETRQFSPHLTLARVPETTPHPVLQQIGREINNYKTVEVGRMQITQLKLIKSDLTPSGPRYTILSTALLQKR